jgi:gliding motility-associated-like protein
MKKHILSFVLTGMIAFSGIAQTTKSVVVDSREYEQMKKDGKIVPGVKLSNPKSFAPSLQDLQNLGAVHRMPASGSGCSCYITPDASYTVAMAPNDDGSTGLMSIPFNFCLYGTNYTSLYINNNGNISFGTSYSTFSSNPFPDPSFIMVAPFWGDVDTRGTGVVKYKITPTAMYVNWEAVGYYSSYTDKVNTFQLIITDGTDPILPSGNNIAFCYGDMQWTTGDASSGVGGFGGVPSTVGINKGDGINYIQMGRFDQPGISYDGGYGANDGVSWLDNQSLYFNSCGSTNIAPIASGLNNCDTIRICGSGDTLILNGLFLSPEIGQTTNLNINLNSTPGATIISNTPGNSANGQVQIIASAANAGNNMITFTATDDGFPVGTTVINVNVFVDTTGLFAFNPVLSGLTEFCQGATSTLSVSPTTFDGYFWSTGSTGTSITVDSSGQYWVTSVENGCYKTNLINVVVDPLPTPVIAGYPYACGGPTNLYSDSLIYATYTWSNASTNDSINVGLGTYTLTVTDTNGCSGTSAPVTVTAPVPPVITGVTAFCNGDSATLTTTIPYVTYSWSTGGTYDSIVVGTPGPFTVTVVDVNGCTITSPPFSVTPFNYALTVGGITSFCANDSILLVAAGTPSAGATYAWSTGDNTASSYVNSGGPVTVTLNYPNGCTADTTVIVPAPVPAPTPVIAGYSYACGGTTYLYSDSLIYANYSWSNSSTNDSINVGLGTYVLTVTDTAGCTGTSLPVTVTAPVPPVITGITAFCNGDSATLTTTIPYVNYTWSTGSTNDSIVVGTTGPYTVTVVDIGGCTLTSPPFSVFPFNYSLTVGGLTSFCTGDSILLVASGTPSTGATYYWSNGDSTASSYFNAGGPTVVTLEYPNGCSVDTTLNVPAPNPIPTPSILGLMFTCSTNSTSIYVDSASLYSSITWSDASTNDSLSTNSGTYSVTVVQNGCTATSSAVTVVNASPVVDIVGNLEFCPGDSTSLFANLNLPSGANYTWSTTDTSSAISVNSNGTYIVTVNYSNGCSTADTVTVTQYGQPVADFSASPPGFAYLGTTTQFTSLSHVAPGTIANSIWNFGDSTSSILPSPAHIFHANGVYHVTLAVQSNNGCWDTITHDYVIISDLQVPNVFTPNNDGKNDFLEFKNIEFFPNTGLTVYNRWGSKIYSSSDYHNDWNGGGHSDGVYYFILDGPELKEPKYGFVQIFNN